MSCLQGMEAMRMWPVDTSNVNIGIGDFFGGNVVDPINVTDPTERLDILTGRLRIRQLPDNAETDSAFRVMVVDNTNDPLERGVVKWKDITSLIPPLTADCEWTMPAAAPNHVYTAFAPLADPDCPDDKEAVAVGVDLSISPPMAKFTTLTDDYDIAGSFTNTSISAATTGVYVEAIGGDANTGIVIRATQGSGDNKGIGIKAVGIGSSAHNYGVRVDLSGTSTRTRGFSAFTTGATYTAYAGEFIAYDNAT